jgi:DNA-binding NarL/FixJ family response regulator
MYISHPDLCSHMSLEVLKEVYNLTTSEAQLALALTNGLSLQKYADSKSASIQTVRSQLKNVFNKVQVNSQTDLVRTLIMSSFNIIS